MVSVFSPTTISSELHPMPFNPALLAKSNVTRAMVEPWSQKVREFRSPKAGIFWHSGSNSATSLISCLIDCHGQDKTGNYRTKQHTGCAISYNPAGSTLSTCLYFFGQSVIAYCS
jgi:hypothetical protein